MHLIGLTSFYIFHRVPTGHGSYLPEVNTTHWQPVICQHRLYLWIYFENDSRRPGLMFDISPALPSSSLLRHLGIVGSLPRERWKSSRCSIWLASNEDGVFTVPQWVYIQICLVTVCDSCAGPLLPPQQAFSEMFSPLDNQQLCSCAYINLSYHRGDFFFQHFLDIGTVDFPRKSAIDSQLLSGYSICLVEF